MSGSTAKNYRMRGDKWVIGGEIELVGSGAITKNGQPIDGGGSGPVEVLRDASSTVAGFRFWGETIDGNANNPGFPVADKKGRKIILKNNTDVTLTQIRAYCFLRGNTGAELHRAQADFANLATGATFVIDSANFPDIDGAWTHISLRTNATGRTTGDVQVIYVSGGQAASGGSGFWYGRDVNFLGDSITNGSGSSVTANRYSSRVSAMLGLRENNYGINGSTIAVKESSPADRNPMVTRYASMSATADLVVVAGGTNDWFYTHTPVGTMASRSNNDFYGALHNLCLGLLDKYTGKQLLFLTPIKRSYPPLDAPDAKNGNGLTLQDYVDIIKEVCGFYGIPTLDNYRELAINPAIPAQKAALIPDGVHPNDAGHDLMARRVVGYLRQLKS